MARTVTAIYNAILTDISNNNNLSELTSTSRTAKYKAFAYVVAMAIYSLEVVMDMFRADVQADLLLMKPHTVIWYRDAAKAFQYGSSLPWGEVAYDNALLTEDEVDAQKIVAHAAVIENSGQLTIKVAKLVSDDLAALAAGELTAFETYFEKIKDAGTKINYKSESPDDFKLEMDIYYDPLVLDSDGIRLDGSDNTPVQDAIRAYLADLPFNGEIIKTKLVDALQVVEGVKIPAIVNAWYKYAALDWQLMGERYTPDAGYARIEDVNLDLNFIADYN